MFTDYMGISVETGCKSLDKKLNSHICYGGQSGQSQRTVVDPDIKALTLPALRRVTDLFQSEQDLGGAALADDAGVRAALDEQDALAQRTLQRGLGEDLIQEDLANLQGQQIAGGLGSLGSARADAARQSGLASRALDLRTADLEARRQAAQGLTASQEARRALDQQGLDAPHTSAQRYFGYLQSAPQGSETHQSGGGK